MSDACLAAIGLKKVRYSMRTHILVTGTLLFVIPFLLLFPAPSFAAVAKGCGDVGVVGLEKVITKPVILATLFILNPADQIIPIPINRVTKGQVGVSARASNFFTSVQDNDPIPGMGDPTKPDFLVGTLLTPGNPPTTGSVSTRQVNAVVTGANANAQAAIAGAVVSGAGGAIFGANANTTTSCGANAFFGRSASAAVAGTDPFVLSPLPSATNAVLGIDLVSNFPSDPNAGFGLLASDSGGGSASSTYSLEAVSNIPGLSTLFEMTFSANSQSNLVDVIFSSPLISQPVLSTDFTTVHVDPNLPDVLLLDPSKKFFTVPFTIPAGVLGSDELGSFGLSLDILSAGTAQASVPEPSTLVLLLISFAVLSLALLRRSHV